MIRRALTAVPLVMAGLVALHHAAAQSISPSSETLSAKTYSAQVLLDQYYGDRANIALAQERIAEILNARPGFVPAYVQAARVMIMGGHIVSYEFSGGTLETAEAILLKAKELEPNNAEVYVLLGHVSFLKRDMDGAIASLNRAKELKSPNPWLDDNYGDVYLSVGKLALAEHHYRLVAELGAGDRPQQRRAYVHALQKL